MPATDVTMRMSLLLRLLLAAACALLANASLSSEHGFNGIQSHERDKDELGQNRSRHKNDQQLHRLSTGENHRHKDETKLNPEERAKAIASVEASLLSILGFKKRPRPVSYTAHVPDKLIKLYAKQSAIGMADIAQRGLHASSANTVRSFVHVGE